MVRRQPVARPTISMAPYLRMSAMCRTGPCLGASLVGRVSAVSFQVRPRIFARRHVIWANGREAFADREHTGKIGSSRQWASREADPPSWPDRVSKVAEIGSSLSWPVQLADGPALFSLRPENIAVVPPATLVASGRVRVRGRVVNQAFHGATELIRVQCAEQLVLVVRTPSSVAGHAEVELEFSPADAVPVRKSAERN